jgi:two-component system sensor histidine kinase YesM
VDDKTRSFVIGSHDSKTLVGGGSASLVLNSGSPDKQWFYRKLPASRFNWTVLAFNTDSLLQQSLGRAAKNNYLMLGAGLVLSAVTAAFITRYIRKPLSFMISRMRLVRQGFLDIEVILDRKDEFGELSHAFDAMLKNNVQLLQQVEQFHTTQREQEIQVLQSQINPHFLYNTLGSISNAVKLGYLERVDPMVGSLIHILEYGVATEPRFVPLSCELSNVREYLSIQNARSKREYPLAEQIEPGLEQFTVFRLLLQPLVENSWFHAYDAGRLPGDIVIRAYRNEGCVYIEVADSGAGMTADKAAQLLAPAEEERKTRKRIGLLNIHQRIQFHYGQWYGLSIESSPGQGTCVRAVLPEERREGN